MASKVSACSVQLTAEPQYVVVYTSAGGGHAMIVYRSLEDKLRAAAALGRPLTVCAARVRISTCMTVLRCRGVVRVRALWHTSIEKRRMIRLLSTPANCELTRRMSRSAISNFARALCVPPVHARRATRIVPVPSTIVSCGHGWRRVKSSILDSEPEGIDNGDSN